MAWFSSQNHSFLFIGQAKKGEIRLEGTKFYSGIGGQVDFNRWVELVTSANGDIYLIGLDTTEEGNELIVFYRFSKQSMQFDLTKVMDIPKDNNTSVLARPNVLITDSGYIGLTYPSETVWFV